MVGDIPDPRSLGPRLWREGVIAPDRFDEGITALYATEVFCHAFLDGGGRVASRARADTPAGSAPGRAPVAR